MTSKAEPSKTKRESAGLRYFQIYAPIYAFGAIKRAGFPYELETGCSLKTRKRNCTPHDRCPVDLEYQIMDRIAAIEQCHREIAAALAEAQRPGLTLNDRLGILIWEMDWRANLAWLESTQDASIRSQAEKWEQNEA